MKTAAVLLVFACLIIVHVQGQAKPSVRRCLCLGRGANFVPPQRIEKVEVYPPSASCEKVEVIVAIKNRGVKRCLNPESSFAKNYIKNVNQKRN